MRDRFFAAPRSLARLRLLLALMFLALALPSALLVRQGFARLGLEEFRRQQLMAESLARSIDTNLQDAIAIENSRPVTDFQFAVAPDPANTSVVQLSPLATLASAGRIPGTIGYFQVDAAGQLSTPLLPESASERDSLEQLQQKVDTERRVAEVLQANRLVGGRADLSDAVVTGSRVPGGRETAGSGPAAEPPARSRQEAQSIVEEQASGQLAFDALANTPVPTSTENERPRAATVNVASFASDVEPLRFSALETGHLVLFRYAWRDGQRYVQGLLVDRDAFVRDSLGAPLRGSGLADGTVLSIAIDGQRVAEAVTGAGHRGDAGLLYSQRLSPPLSDIELGFAVGTLGRGPGFGLLVWTTLALGAALAGGFVTIYLFGKKQLRLVRDQKNFVSAISHELKTPLTSIRMYGEMLQSGWADEAKKQTYYDFIVAEGERLSRLIDNVLELSRLGNGATPVDHKTIGVGELFEQLRSKLITQAERADFELEFEIADDARNLLINGDPDALTQVFINLVDNAIKFSAGAERREIRLSARCLDAGHVLLTVRDFGPGISPPALKRLFELFYRADDELTRSTAGTGIGLALVRQLVTAMGGRIDARNCDPGAEFRLSLPLAQRVARPVAPARAP
jgi:two-component system phosphate regulon sensor histidine kinase PhoR